MAHSITLTPFRISLRLALLLLVYLPVAKGWEFRPYLSLTESYTDNLRLSATNEESELVTTLTPGFSLNRDGPTHSLNLDYQESYLFYREESGEETTQRRFNLASQHQLVRGSLFFDLTGSIQRQQADLTASEDTEVGLIEQRTESQSYRLNPYWLKKWGGVMQSRLDLSADGVRYPQSANEESDAVGVGLNLQSGNAFSNSNWSLDYRREKVEYQTLNPQEMERLGVAYRYATRSQLGLIAHYDKEEDLTAKDADADFRHESWQAGLEWRPTTRLQLSIERGDDIGTDGDGFWTGRLNWNPGRRLQLTLESSQRFQQDTYLLKLAHQGRRSSLTADYQESITSTRREILLQQENSPPLPLSRNTSFLQKSLNMGWTYRQRRTDYSFRYTDTRRSYDESGVSGDRNNQAVLQLNSKLVDSSSLQGSISYSRALADSEPEPTYSRLFTLGWSRPLLERVNLSITYSHNRQIEIDPSLGYRQNRLDLTLKATL